LPLQSFQFGQYEAKRRVASFGFRYDYTMRRLEEAHPIPEWLGSIIEKVEAFGGRGTRIGQVLCTAYDVGVGIGWHRDKPHFDRVFGLSLGSACKFRFRRPAYTKWERFTLEARPRSIYMMSGAVAGGLGTQHPCRRGAALLDHLPDDGREILMACPNLCYLLP
jgi:alkylated DNA repair dioxygenase AlkB